MIQNKMNRNDEKDTNGYKNLMNHDYLQKMTFIVR